MSFQTEYRILVTESDDIQLENYCALTNSNIKFIACMRQFLQHFHEMTGVDTEKLRQNMNVAKLNKGFAEISNSAYARLQCLVKDQITEAFLEIKDYKSIVIVVYCNIATIRRKPVHGTEDHI